MAWLGISEAAREFGVAPSTMRRWLDSGCPSWIGPDGARVVNPKAVEAFLASEADDLDEDEDEDDLEEEEEEELDQDEIDIEDGDESSDDADDAEEGGDSEDDEDLDEDDGDDED